jgi:large subunit ribosomal protein L29
VHLLEVMKMKEIRDLGVADLSARRKVLGDELFQLRLQHSAGQLERPSQIRSVRREIARVESALVSKSVKAPQSK